LEKLQANSSAYFTKAVAKWEYDCKVRPEFVILHKQKTLAKALYIVLDIKNSPILLNEAFFLTK
jgi:hypothetical protein